MIYPSSIEKKLGFDAIRVLLLEACKSPLGAQYVNLIKPSVKLDQIQIWINQVAEFKNGIVQGVIPGIGELYDIRNTLKQAEVDGAVIDTDLLNQVAKTLSVANMLHQSLLVLDKISFPELSNLSEKVIFPAALLKALSKVFDGEGKIKDDASNTLKEIRKSFRVEEGRLRSIIQKAFKQAQKDGLVPEGTTISVRENRMVIPINSSNKRHINGFVHDESASGTISYIEPVESLEANNKIRELELAERREVYAILAKLTELIRIQLFEVKSTVFFIGIIDFISAKAKIGLKLDGNTPKLISQPNIELIEAKHPQLVLSFAKEEREVVPLTVKLDTKHHLLLISGPNAGGKSVALKTIGINQYMLQCGVLPLVHSDSKMSVFDDIFIDIGDEQSIDNDLSTYSSHLKNMKTMLKHACGNSLILIDEFGTGTDPLFGGAIAEAMLEQFVSQKCFGAITTHYSNLKTFAERTEGIINGAMRFNMKDLEPEYALEVGRPGSSFALELAQKSGVQGEVIKNAKSKLGADQLDIEKLLNKLERQKQKLRERETSLKVKENRVAQLEKKYEELNESIETKKAEIIEKARVEAANLLKNTNRKIEKTIRHIKESKAEKKETKKVRKSLSSFSEEVNKDIKNNKPKISNEPASGLIIVGSYAVLDEGTSPVKVIEIKEKEAKIMAGNFTSYVKLNRLTKVSNKAARSAERNVTAPRNSFSIVDKRADFSSKLDVRGKRSEEIYTLIDSFMNDAVMLDQSEVRVLHGKGSGVLRDIIRQQLKEYPFVAHFKDEHIERGGAGITVINLQ
ncbi:Recombination inhibitory protein MutS2 [hydrothermal vent metagenome]|uniref:Recombination inhibitory protein MutS2 n=1 Tax=hydrothermal vent metagenome TaxID=652676 RepID=A0A3B0UH45_9ZZZZ